MYTASKFRGLEKKPKLQGLNWAGSLRVRIASVATVQAVVNKMDEGRRDELDAKIRKLKTNSSQWASLPIAEKISLLEQVIN
jgi:hypothetical protein